VTDPSARLRNITGRRLLAAFTAVLLLFAAALAIELFTLQHIAAAEAEVASVARGRDPARSCRHAGEQRQAR
jgi:hypothetical protein